MLNRAEALIRKLDPDFDELDSQLHDSSQSSIERPRALFKRSASSHPFSRFSVIMDSHVGLSSLVT